MLKDIKTARKIATELLEIKAVRLNTRKPFQWASGWKSPIYCDNRMTLSFPEIRSGIRDALASVVRSRFPGAHGIAGVATAGIPQGVLVADKLSLPFAYVRARAKDHGLANQIEGKVEKGSQWVVIEDLISTGGSSLAAVDALRAVKAKVVGMVSIFTYGFLFAENNFREKKVEWISLCDYSTLLEVARERKYITPSQLVELKSWRTDPANWKT